MTLPADTVPVRHEIAELADCQQQLIDALAAADHAAVLAATAEMRLALLALDRLPDTAYAEELPALVRSNHLLRETMRARLSQARLALDALGLRCNSFDARGQSSYQPS